MIYFLSFFYDELSVVKTDKDFRRYAMTYNFEVIDKKNSLSQLEGNKSSNKDLFNDLLDETKDFKYQVLPKSC